MKEKDVDTNLSTLVEEFNILLKTKNPDRQTIWDLSEKIHAELGKLSEQFYEMKENTKNQDLVEAISYFGLHR